MTSGDSQKRASLVKVLRGLSYSKLDLSFLIGDGSPDSGYDRYGKYKVRFGWGIAFGLTFLTALWVYMSFFPKRTTDFNDPELVWTRANSYWLVPLVLLSWFFVNKSDRKNDESETDKMSKAIAKSGLIVLPDVSQFPGATEFSTLVNGTVHGRAYGVMSDGQLQVAFGETFQRWDAITKPMFTLHGEMGPFPSLFMFVAVPGLQTHAVNLTPKNQIDWDLLPQLSQKGRAALSRLASRYAVVVGAGGIVVGLAEETNNSFQSSLTGTMSTPTGWKICLDIISGELADIIEGLG